MKFTTPALVGLLTLVYSALALPRMDAAAMKRMAENLAAREAEASGDSCGSGSGSSGSSGNNGQGRLISFPGPPSDTGLKQIPDADHPYMPPGPGDLRGPCPALNTLANHGYIPRNGVATVEQILTAVMEGFNMEHDFGRFVVSFATLARGNPYTGQLSIGGESDLVPHMPGNPDGAAPPGGIAKHGRFEGDVSISRSDNAIGDSVDFQEKQFDNFVLYVGKYGEDGPDGPMTVVTQKAFQEFKFNDFNTFMAQDPKFSFQVGRQFTTFGEVSFVLNMFANGTDGKLSVNGMASIFRNQTFAPNWFRRSSPADFTIITGTAGIIRGAHDYPAGQKVNGVWTLDTQPTNFLCDAYTDLLVNQVSGAMMKTTGIFKQNVDQLVSNAFAPFHDKGNCTTKAFPNGPAGM